MELKPGYKQTEVGIIPEDWDVQPMGVLTDPKRPISYGIVQTGPNIQNGVKCLRVLDIEDGRINRTDLITTTKAISDTYKRTILKFGDLVTPLRGKVGDVALVDADLVGSNLTRGVALIAIKPELSAPYFKQYISSIATRNRLEQSMNGSALQEVPIATFRAFTAAFPPTKAEQEAIAGALSDADALIESLEKLIAKKRQIKQGAMQQLLTGQTRLPGFTGEWEMKMLPQVCLFRGGKAHEQHIAEFGKFVCVNSKFISTEGNERKYSTENLCCARKNDILMVMSDLPNGRALAKTYLVEQDDLYAVNQRVCALTVYHGNSKFLSYYLNRNPYFLKFDDGVSQTHLLNNIFLNCPLRIPPTVTEQTAIANILSDMDAEIEALEAKLAKARQVKQGMMQELLTGRIRLI